MVKIDFIIVDNQLVNILTIALNMQKFENYKAKLGLQTLGEISFKFQELYCFLSNLIYTFYFFLS